MLRGIDGGAALTSFGIATLLGKIFDFVQAPRTPSLCFAVTIYPQTFSVVSDYSSSLNRQLITAPNRVMRLPFFASLHTRPPDFG